MNLKPKISPAHKSSNCRGLFRAHFCFRLRSSLESKKMWVVREVSERKRRAQQRHDNYFKFARLVWRCWASAAGVPDSIGLASCATSFPRRRTILQTTIIRRQLFWPDFPSAQVTGRWRNDCTLRELCNNSQFISRNSQKQPTQRPSLLTPHQQVQIFWDL